VIAGGPNRPCRHHSFRRNLVVGEPRTGSGNRNGALRKLTAGNRPSEYPHSAGSRCRGRHEIIAPDARTFSISRRCPRKRDESDLPAQDRVGSRQWIAGRVEQLKRSGRRGVTLRVSSITCRTMSAPVYLQGSPALYPGKISTPTSRSIRCPANGAFGKPLRSSSVLRSSDRFPTAIRCDAHSAIPLAVNRGKAFRSDS